MIDCYRIARWGTVAPREGEANASHKWTLCDGEYFLLDDAIAALRQLHRQDVTSEYVVMECHYEARVKSYWSPRRGMSDELPSFGGAFFHRERLMTRVRELMDGRLQDAMTQEVS